jgi:hypothetical protein
VTEISVYRAATQRDAYNDPQDAAFVLFGAFEGDVSWTNPDEKVEPGRNTVIAARGVFIRTASSTGIRESDQVAIDGIRFAIDGMVAEWAHGGTIGTQFALKAVVR